MYNQYHKEYSHHLGYDMEFEVFGHAGTPLLVFPPQGSHFYEWKNRGMIDTLRPFIDSGRIRVFCADSNDAETVDDVHRDPLHAAWRLECYHRYITEELVPRIKDYTQSDAGPITTGASMGATHAANMYLRRPDLFSGVLAISGIYDSRFFFGEAGGEYAYKNSPVQFLADMAWDHPWLDYYRGGKLSFVIGQGAWEDDLLPSNRRLRDLFSEKQVPVWFDFWGHDVDHDWPWWHKMLPHFLKEMV